MSRENVEIVRANFDAWNAREPAAELLSRFHPDVVYHPRADEPDPSPLVGREALRELVSGFADAFSEVTFEVLELTDAGDRVITSTVLNAVLHGQGGASGASVSDTYVFVHRLRDGLITEAWEYKTKEEALEATGLGQ